MSRIGDDPFADPPGLRDPARRLRGRLPAPVTLWTARGPGGDLGLTVSSLLVVEGHPPGLVGLLGPLTDLLEVVRESGRFVVHVLGAGDRRIAEVFAGRYPGSDPFEGLTVVPGTHGPVLERLATRAHCSLLETTELGYSVLVRAAIDRVELAPGASRPLAYHRGEYRMLGDQPG